MKTGFVILAAILVACGASAAPQWVAEIDVGANLIMAMYGPTTQTNAVSEEGYAMVYVTQPEYNAAYNAIKSLPLAQRSTTNLPAAKVAAAIDAADDYEADPDNISNRLMKAIVKAVVQIGNQRWRNGQTVSAAEVKQAIKDNL